MQKPCRHETPPLTLHDGWTVFPAEEQQRLAVDSAEAAFAGLHAVNRGGDIQAGVDQQNDDGVEPRLWNKAAEHRRVAAGLRSPGRHGLTTIRAHAVARID